MWMEIATSAAKEISRAIVPVCCPGCGLDDVRWCDECEAPWWDEPFRSEGDAARLHRLGEEPLVAWSIVDLDGAPHRMIEAWKDADRRDLDGFFRRAMSRAARSISASVATVDRVAVVPIPARRASTRRRGIDLPELLAQECASMWRHEGIDAIAAPMLTMSRAESRGLSARQRWRGAQRSMRVVRPPDLTRAVVVVDDVMTTGATIATARDCLERAGAVVCAAVTLAAAPMRSAGPSVALGWSEEADILSDTFDGGRG